MQEHGKLLLINYRLKVLVCELLLNVFFTYFIFPYAMQGSPSQWEEHLKKSQC